MARINIQVIINCHYQAQATNLFYDKIDQDSTGFRYLEWKVIDEGSGIPDEDLPYIFDKFYQAIATGSNKKNGKGTGLSLTKGFVELHQGKIWVQNKLNEGTSYSIHIPIDLDTYTISEISEQDIKDIEIGIVPDSIEGFGNEPGFRGNEDQSLEKPEILIVEDNDDLRNFLNSVSNRVYLTFILHENI